MITAVIHVRGISHSDLVHPSKSSASLTAGLLVPLVLLLVPLIVLLDIALTSALEALFPVSAWEQRAFADMAAATLPAFISTCLIAPAEEEMLFRGILLRSFLARYPRGVAIGYSALYFGATHMNIYQFLLAFLLGLLLGWPYERSRSLSPCIALHAVVNGVVVMWGASTGPAATPTLTAVPAVGWLAAVAAATLGTVVLRRLLCPKQREIGQRCDP